ncbi:MAG: type II secretion system protein [Planctomycetes bacterium]|nr:type II secretion system protein [Planctomycetota bacterium]
MRVREKGTTLLEMAIAVSVTGILAVTAVPASGPAVRRSALVGAARTLAAHLRYAVAASAHSAGPLEVRFDEAAATYTLWLTDPVGETPLPWPGQRADGTRLGEGLALAADFGGEPTLALAAGTAVPSGEVSLTGPGGTARVRLAGPLGSVELSFDEP